jgi:dTDP-4-amino-4,6-dideoxygalactose transaminase
MIPFNKPHLTGKELEYIRQAVNSGKISGNGEFTAKCQNFFQKRYGFKKCLLTSSCTDALEMAAMLANIKPGDEVIIPSFTFVSTALAFVREGAKIVFADSCTNHPNMDVSLIEPLITERTKAIVPVHYAGAACDLDSIIMLAQKYNLMVIEDAAQAVDSHYKGKPLGSIGNLGCFSFHETKNIISGEGGMLAINDESLLKRAEIIWEKGTNRAEFFRGEVNKYGWVDTGSSFLPSELTAAFLYAQLENLDTIQQKRKLLWDTYYTELVRNNIDKVVSLPVFPAYAHNNAHMFYIVCSSLQVRNSLIDHLKKNGILAVSHYLSLHASTYYSSKHDGRELPNSDAFTDKLLRLPLFFELEVDDVKRIVSLIAQFFKENG